MEGTAIKAIIASIGGFISWVAGGIGWVFTILLGLMLLDYLTGLMTGWVLKELSSRKAATGFVKKLYIVILIGAVYMVERTVLGSSGVVADGVAIAYCVIEFLSIVENGGKMGAPLGPLGKVIAVLKAKQEDDVK